jgi:hypothetical protein
MMVEKLITWLTEKMPNLLGLVLLTFILWSLLQTEQSERVRLTNKLLEPRSCLVGDSPTERAFPD